MSNIVVEDFFTSESFFRIDNHVLDPAVIITCVASSHTTDDVVIGTSKGDVFWMSKKKGTLIEKFSDQKSAITCLKMRDGKAIYSLADDGSLKIYKIGGVKTEVIDFKIEKSKDNDLSKLTCIEPLVSLDDVTKDIVLGDDKGKVRYIYINKMFKTSIEKTWDPRSKEDEIGFPIVYIKLIKDILFFGYKTHIYLKYYPNGDLKSVDFKLFHNLNRPPTKSLSIFP